MNIKKFTVSFLFLFGLLGGVSGVSAQGMMGSSYFNGLQNRNIPSSALSDATQDEIKGKTVWDQLQSKQKDCKNLTDDDFEVLGDYFMGVMMGNGYASMNYWMTQMMGNQGEKQMHIVMGKRYSGCDALAVLPTSYQGFSYLIPMMMNGYNYQNYPMVGSNPMMSGYQISSRHNAMMGAFGFAGISFSGWVSLILVWIVLILAIAALAKFISRPQKK